MSELYSILEQTLQMTECLASDLRRNRTQTCTKIADTTKSAVRQLAIGEG